MVKPIYLLDTNTWIYALKGQPAALLSRMGAVDPDEIALCSVVKAELLYGAYRSGNQAKQLELLHSLFSRHRSFGFDDSAAEIYARIRRGLERDGKIIGPMDLLIAAIALANDLVLVTHNTAEFRRIADLQLADWAI